MNSPDPVTSLVVILLTIGLSIALFWPNKGIYIRWKRALQFSNRILQEDTLKHIHKCEMGQNQPTLQSIAGTLRISINQSANTITNLQKFGLVCLENGIICLTPKGREYSMRIIRAHRLWERHLAENTGYLESDWHDQAEHQEHFISDDEANALAVELGHPTHDPHGDPIPTQTGKLAPHGGTPLSQLPLELPIRIVHLEDEPPVIYNQLIAEGLHPGMEVIITEKTAQRIRFWANGEEHVLAPLLANNISATITPRKVEQPSGVPLTELKHGETGRIIQISRNLRGTERRRLMDLGFVPETEITVEMRSPGGDPTAYRLRNTLIALRKEQADLIRIEKINLVINRNSEHLHTPIG